jgi:hypothetical protein
MPYTDGVSGTYPPPNLKPMQDETKRYGVALSASQWHVLMLYIDARLDANECREQRDTIRRHLAEMGVRLTPEKVARPMPR